jgi:AbrB family looped-hinge helix DNA binding protein
MISMVCITNERSTILMEKPEGKYAWTVTVGTKGQIVIPKEARDVFNINPGDHLLILADVKQGMAIPPTDSFDEYFKKIFG